MRKLFDKELSILNEEMIRMGALCEEAIALSVKAMTEGDISLTEKVVTISSELDQKESDIEARCLKLILHQQPVARDLRQISAALKMITDMERIGDQAEDIAEIVVLLNGINVNETLKIRDMAQATIKMVNNSVDAYVKQDIKIAQSVIDCDDIVDDYFDKTKKQLIDVIAKNPNDGEYALDLLMIAKYFERIGDHATNIAEWVIFSVTGIHNSN